MMSSTTNNPPQRKQYKNVNYNDRRRQPDDCDEPNTNQNLPLVTGRVTSSFSTHDDMISDDVWRRRQQQFVDKQQQQLKIPVLHTKVVPDTTENVVNGNKTSSSSSQTKIPKLALQKSHVTEKKKRSRSAQPPPRPRQEDGDGDGDDNDDQQQERHFQTVLIQKGVTMKRVVEAQRLLWENQNNPPKMKKSRRSSTSNLETAVTATKSSTAATATTTKSTTNNSTTKLKRKSVALELPISTSISNSNNNLVVAASSSSANGEEKKKMKKTKKKRASKDGEDSPEKKNNLPSISQAAASAVESYKTLDEFLVMPKNEFPSAVPDAATTLPPEKSGETTTATAKHKEPKSGETTTTTAKHKEPPPTAAEKSKEPAATTSKPPYYKSRFWEYLTTNKNTSNKKTTPNNTTTENKAKPYDPAEVQSFMQKQQIKEKAKRIAEYKAREEELQMKKQRLSELDEKCRNLASIKSTTNSARGKVNQQNSNVDVVVVSNKMNKEEMLRKELDGLVRIATTSSVKSDKPPTSAKSNAKSTILLKEFENIVKQECINFFEAAKLKRQQQKSSSTSNKAVETTESLLEGPKSASSISSPSTSSPSPHSPQSVIISLKSSNNNSAVVKETKKSSGGSNTLTSANWAASKIQAAYKGHKLRKVLTEANLLPKDVVKSRIYLQSSFDTVGTPTRLQKTPERPYESQQRIQQRKKLSSPYGHTPPSFMTTTTTADSPSPHRQKPPPPIIIMSSKKKSFNEPYPKEAIMKIQQEQQEKAAECLSRRNSMSDIIKMIPSSEQPFVLLVGSGSGGRRATIGGGLLSAAVGDGGENNTSNNNTTTVVLNRRKSDVGDFCGMNVTSVLLQKLRLLERERKMDRSCSEGTSSPSCSILSSIPPIQSSSPGNQSLLNTTIEENSDSDASAESVRKTSTPIIVQQKKYHAIKKQPTKRIKSKSPARKKLKSDEDSTNSRANDNTTTSTTVETDLDFVDFISNPQHQKKKTTSSNTTNLHIPTMIHLQYEAERERMAILDKALKVTTKKLQQPTTTIKTSSIDKEEIVAIAKTAAGEQLKAKLAELENKELKEKLALLQNNPNHDKTHLEIMKCQQAASASTAELTKFMAELQRSHLKDVEMREASRGRDVASIVFAAVDEAKEAYRNIGEYRRGNLLKEKKARLEKLLVGEVGGGSVASKETQVSASSDVGGGGWGKLKQGTSSDKGFQYPSSCENSVVVDKTDNIKGISSSSSAGDGGEKISASLASDHNKSQQEEVVETVEEALVSASASHHELLSQEEQTENPSMDENVSSQNLTPVMTISSQKEVLLEENNKTESIIDSASDFEKEDYSTSVPVDVESAEVESIANNNSSVGNDSEHELSKGGEEEVVFAAEEEEKVKEDEEDLTKIEAQSSTQAKVNVEKEEAVVKTCKEEVKQLEQENLENEIRLLEAVSPASHDELLSKEEQIKTPSINENISTATATPTPTPSQNLTPIMTISNQEQEEEHNKTESIIDSIASYASDFEKEDLFFESSANNVSVGGGNDSEDGLPGDAEESITVGDEEVEEKVQELEKGKIVEEQLSSTQQVVQVEKVVKTDDEEEEEQLEDILQEQEKVENEIRLLEALQQQAQSPIADYLNALEERQQQQQPPPPYSPSSFIPPPSDDDEEEEESSSLLTSQQKPPFQLTPDPEKIHQIVKTQVDQIWEHWKLTGELVEISSDDDDEEQQTNQEEIATWATTSFTKLLKNLTTEKIKESLKISELEESNFVDLHRTGPIALQAIKDKLPKSKEACIRLVFDGVLDVLPSWESDGVNSKKNGRKLSKWCCRERDIVEEVLIEEMVEDEPKWTEFWPEELLIVEELCSRILKNCVSDVLDNVESAFSNTTI